MTGAPLEDARRAKDVVARRCEGQPWLRGVGLCPVEGGYGVRVDVAPEALDAGSDAPSLPAEVDGVPVELHVVGRPQAL